MKKKKNLRKKDHKIKAIYWTQKNNGLSSAINNYQ